jgi:hypothetical protein
MECKGIEIKYNVGKRLPKMALLKPYGEFDRNVDEAIFEIYSPVFDIQNVTIPVHGKLSGQVELQMQSFFLVFDSPEHKKLCWKPIQECTVTNHPYRGQ